jgi:nucleotide exchange factor SIL1
MIIGQSIPQGLHVRLNLKTGEREAKLLHDSERTDLTSLPEDALDQGISLEKLQAAFSNLPGEESTVSVEVLIH